MIKVYEIKGVVECSRVFRIGKLSVRCDFAGGAVNESGIVPAIYSTNNPVTQAIIENSDLYKKQRVTIQSSTEEESDKSQFAPEEGGVKSQLNSSLGNEGMSTNDFPEVKNSQMAKEILMNEPYNTPLSELSNKTAIQAKAVELNITFSNWS